MDQKSKREERRDDTQTQRSSFYLLYFFIFKIVCMWYPGVYPVYPVLVEILYTVQYCILVHLTTEQ